MNRLVLLLACCLMTTSAAGAEVGVLARYYEGLRERHLFLVAEADLLRRLNDPQIDPGRRSR